MRESTVGRAGTRGWAWALAALLAASAGGMAAADAAAAADAVGPASLQVRRDGRWLPLPESRGLVRLAAAEGELRLRLDGAAAGRRHRVWLEGQDLGWVEFGAGGERRYPPLPPGLHRLRLQSAQAGAGWSAPRELALLVDPPWWRSPAALLAAGLVGLAGLAWLAMAYRLRQRRRLAWQLAQSRRELAEQHSEAKSRFLASLGHEIRTPMTGVLGMAELLLADGLDARQRERVEAIQRAGLHLLRLVNDALDLARIESGKLVLDELDFDPRALLGEVAGLLQPLAAAKGLAFGLELAPDLPARLRGDPTRLRQVLFNLGHNAVKFSARGRVGLQAGRRAGGGLDLCVSDEGPGLDEAAQARLFQRFEPGPASTGPGTGAGSGLGLAISRELVQAMGGSIRVDSGPGRGSRFRVGLPLPELAAPDEAPAVESPPLAARRLLLVEDEALVADVVAGLLRQQGHEVVHAANALSALAALEHGAYDLALLDLDLPGMDGLALARLLRARGETLPLLALTARADAGAEPAARAAGMDGFLRKPVTGELLSAAIGRQLAAAPG